MKVGDNVRIVNNPDSWEQYVKLEVPAEGIIVEDNGLRSDQEQEWAVQLEVAGSLCDLYEPGDKVPCGETDLKIRRPRLPKKI